MNTTWKPFRVGKRAEKLRDIAYGMIAQPDNLSHPSTGQRTPHVPASNPNVVRFRYPHQTACYIYSFYSEIIGVLV